MSRLEVDPSEIDTPWPAQPIAWRNGWGDERAETLRWHISGGAEFIVREVLIHHPDKYGEYRLSSTDEAEDAFAETNRQFEILAEQGIVCAPTQWHSFIDEEKEVRALARVAVVEGEVYPHTSRAPKIKSRIHAAYTRIENYYNAVADGHQLADLYRINQFMFGVFRNPELRATLTPGPKQCLIDIEPIYWFVNNR